MKISIAMLSMIGLMGISQINCGSPDQALYAVTEATVMDDAGIDVVDAGQWTPELLAGLVLWLDGTQGVDNGSGAVDKWADQSGKMNDAIPVSLGSNAPLLVPSSIGGHPAVHFDGTNYLSIKDAESLQFGADEFVIAIAARHTTPTVGTWGYGLFFSKYEKAFPYTGPILIGNTETGTTQVQAQLAYKKALVTSTQSGLNNDKPMVILMHRKASGAAFSLEVRLNGAPSGIETGNAFALDVSALGRPVFIAGTPDAQNIVGDIAEVVAAKGAIPDGDILALEGYLKTKYGL